MKLWTLLILATIGGIIGWITNLLAIKLLFRPFEPINIPIFNWKLQGLIPKRRDEIAISIGKTIENDLLSIEDIIFKLMNNENKEEIFSILKTKINQVVSTKLPSLIPSAFKGMIQNYINEMIDKEGDKIIDDIIQDIIENGDFNISLANMIEEKINEFPMDKLEELVIEIAKTELKHIEILGGVLGFIIGIFQGLIIVIM